jgi:hypothetical protein
MQAHACCNVLNFSRAEFMAIFSRAAAVSWRCSDVEHFGRESAPIQNPHGMTVEKEE